MKLCVKCFRNGKEVPATIPRNDPRLCDECKGMSEKSLEEYARRRKEYALLRGKK